VIFEPIEAPSGYAPLTFRPKILTRRVLLAIANHDQIRGTKYKLEGKLGPHIPSRYDLVVHACRFCGQPQSCIGLYRLVWHGPQVKGEIQTWLLEVYKHGRLDALRCLWDPRNGYCNSHERSKTPSTIQRLYGPEGSTHSLLPTF
jgi:hypothetical protein